MRRSKKPAANIISLVLISLPGPGNHPLKTWIRPMRLSENLSSTSTARSQA